MIEAQHLTKWFGPLKAVDDLTFEIPSGEVVGFLGPNGAGKSTTLRMLTGYLPPSIGTVRLAGHDINQQLEKARASVGYLPESTPLYTEMRVDEYLHYRGRLMKMPRKKRVERINAVCQRTGLSHNQRRVIGHLSKGNRQRVGIAQALLHEPPILILDEPTAGLDPTQITHIRDLLAELRGRHTIILSTHILPEIERTADRLMIIAAGRILAQGTIESLRDRIQASSRLYVEIRETHDLIHAEFKALPYVKAVEAARISDGWSSALLTLKDVQADRGRLATFIAEKRWIVREMRLEGGTLEEFFIRTTAGGIVPDAA